MGRSGMHESRGEALPFSIFLGHDRIQRSILGKLLLHFRAVDGREDLFHPARLVKLIKDGGECAKLWAGLISEDEMDNQAGI